VGILSAWRWTVAKSPSPLRGREGELWDIKVSATTLAEYPGRGGKLFQARRSPQLFIYSVRTDYSKTGLPFATEGDRLGPLAREPLTATTLDYSVVDWMSVFVQCSVCRILSQLWSHSNSRHQISKYLACAACPRLSV
jgi:hypothetical protein